MSTTAKPPRARRPRGPISASSNKFIGTWMPLTLVEKIDGAVDGSDSDRSKFLRAAVREKLERLNLISSAS